MQNGTGKMAWEGILTHPMGGRIVEKPRHYGKTVCSDLGLSLDECKQVISNCGPYIDRIKVAFGTSIIYSRAYLEAKIQAYLDARIQVNPGGTCGEIALYEKAFDAWLIRARELGFTTIEVSDGTISMDDTTRCKTIEKVLAAGFECCTEVGKKMLDEQLAIKEAVRQVKRDLQYGVSTVTVESRGSAKGVGVYDKDGKIKVDDVEAYLDSGVDPQKLTWEAPLKDAQEFFIAYFGNNVNLANIRVGEVIALESMRCGLRGDTLNKVIKGKA